MRSFQSFNFLIENNFIDLIEEDDHIFIKSNQLESDHFCIFRFINQPKNALFFYRYRPWKAWLRPISTTKFEELPIDNIEYILVENQDGQYLAIIPLLCQHFRCSIGFDQELGIKITKTNSKYENEEYLLGIFKGINPYRLIEKSIKFCLEKSNISQLNLRKNKQYPSKLEKITWCTWNSFYTDINQDKILESVSKLKKNGLNLKNIMIDDGWLSIDENRKLISFEADILKFKDGLKNLVEMLKNIHHIDNIGVWHTLNGYWSGINHISEEFKNIDFISYPDQETWLIDQKKIDTFYASDPKSVNNFFLIWHQKLKEAGINWLKIDNQLVAERIWQFDSQFQDTVSQIQNQIQESVLKHFDGNVINCMGMGNYVLWNLNKSAIARISEDYFPQNDTWHPEHGNAAIHINSAGTNNLFASQFVWGDFDMFQTHDPNAEYHAMARAISGGPIYFSDEIDRFNILILQPLCYTNGEIIRLKNPALPTRDCLFNVYQNQVYKLFNMHQYGGLLALFNVCNLGNIEARFSISDIEEIKGNNFIIFDFINQKIIKSTTNEQHLYSLKLLKSYYFNIYNIDNQCFIVIGLIDKYNSIDTYEIIEKSINKIIFKLKDDGIFWIYSQTKSFSINKKDFVFEDNLIKIIGTKNQVIEIVNISKTSPIFDLN